MRLPAIMDEYFQAALKLASFERVDEAFAATVPGATGIVAFGITQEECTNDLQRRLEDWVTASLLEGEQLSVFSGIDVAGAEAHALAGYHSHPATTPDSTFIENGEYLLRR